MKFIKIVAIFVAGCVVAGWLGNLLKPKPPPGPKPEARVTVSVAFANATFKITNVDVLAYDDCDIFVNSTFYVEHIALPVKETRIIPTYLLHDGDDALDPRRTAIKYLSVKCQTMQGEVFRVPPWGSVNPSPLGDGQVG